LKNPKNEVSNQLGNSGEMAADSCAHIRQQFSYKVSGFYWVKVECSKEAMRVFCDFSIFKGTFYALLGPLKEGEVLQNVGRIQEI